MQSWIGNWENETAAESGFHLNAANHGGGTRDAVSILAASAESVVVGARLNRPPVCVQDAQAGGTPVAYFNEACGLVSRWTCRPATSKDRPNANRCGSYTISLSPRCRAISGSSVGSRPQLLHAAASRLIASLCETLLVSCNDSRRTLWADAHSYCVPPLRG